MQMGPSGHAEFAEPEQTYMWSQKVSAADIVHLKLTLHRQPHGLATCMNLA